MRTDDPVEPKREVERAITVLLRRLNQPPYYVVLTVNPATEDPAAAAERQATLKLHSQGYVSLVGDSSRHFQLTPSGWEYRRQRHLRPVVYWLYKNWFPATVAAMTIVVGLFQVLD